MVYFCAIDLGFKKKYNMTKVERKRPVVLNNVQDDSFKWKPLPKAAGKWPYRLDINKVLLGEDLSSSMQFHMVGDTGSVKHSDFQRLVAKEMTSQISMAEQDFTVPSFLLHLGDIVYNHGEANEYPAQFFDPYEQYPAPIFAIPGNHDADINPDSKTPYASLAAFTEVFCAREQQLIAFSKGSNRLSMIQPNVYWTLKTPLANFICLYGNITKFGTITEEQEAWFIQELLNAHLERPDKALIICLHHAPYSADTNHGSSLQMISFLEKSYDKAGVKPDIVFSGHVHSYQRFSKHYTDGTIVPYIVAGAGGYAGLHPIAKLDDANVTDDLAILKDVRLENYCDDCYGFLKVEIKKINGNLLLTGEYHTLADNCLDGVANAVLFERFYVPLRYPEYSL
ncbi:3',5'-cyclic AMP phosphodiesterase CpdA [Olivibacter domesticus]|uniref:3',5'-cyclic AMP phosphodiesterase CpdA n=2 Tax=Olivibacter domesticus TaxID=407022 RepID=A0A1H7XS99_OLID1|nr:3',5'-cyclic AMP phosphodiesterase CpdA [Olivibacter domesticus]